MYEGYYLINDKITVRATGPREAAETALKAMHDDRRVTHVTEGNGETHVWIQNGWQLRVKRFEV